MLSVFGDGQGRGCCGVYTRIPKECLASLLLHPKTAESQDGWVGKDLEDHLRLGRTGP